MMVYKMVAGRPKDVDDVTALLSSKQRFDESSVLATLREFDSILDTDRAGEFQRLLRDR